MADSRPRKGARTVASVDPEVLTALEAGTMESANLTEGLAIDMRRLMGAVAPAVRSGAIDPDSGVVQRMAQGGAALRDHGLASALADHPSDTVRGWAAFAIGQDPQVAPMARLAAIQRFAADVHFGVREWAWMAVRAIIVADPLASIAQLTPWTAHTDVGIRRFASEATRPRGVWAASIPLLRAAPAHALPILEALRYDPERFVGDSVANWINDAAKDRPDWVCALLDEWQGAGVAARLIKRAGRSMPTP
jgi:3-methyladenine DNA glycosylase AlkC